ncbi:hypothetical protein A3F37_00640 [Candidatus Saccharibacteria bacterium RIFCSPHIGHO2_12_FULL_41_12]|nr:MAG: hypothetical protein A3F37_00640 [Candidatus Saccharibacteria bacterium RIFCSPHIGHO2_12_FULL_41_12]
MTKNIQIVDDVDELIGHKKRDEIDYTKDTYRSSALWIINSRGEVLIAQRKTTRDKDPGKWGPSAAGTVEEGETYDTNVYKEAKEEIGLSGYTFKKLKKEKIDKPRSQFVQWYGAVVDEPIEYFTAQLDEVEQLSWVKEEELLDDVSKNPDKYVFLMISALNFLRQFA